MFEGANYLLFERAKLLRRNMTKAEEILWMFLRSGINGIKFRRQHPISNYIADFFCHKAKLIIEIDGGIHLQNEVQQLDKEKQASLERLGYTVLRFSNRNVIHEPEKVLVAISEKIYQIINKPTPHSEYKSPL